MYNYQESQSFNILDSESTFDNIENFISLYSTNILSLREELERLYHYSSPFFLCKMQFHHLVDFFVKELFEKTYTTTTNPLFISFYITELQISYNVVQYFLKKHFRHNLSVQNWEYFCYIMTDLYEIRD
jgi:hypothetical protein